MAAMVAIGGAVASGSSFRMHDRLAPRLAGERRFLLGDAGHLSSPFGGEGLNSGLHDACNLGWKLAPSVRGQAAQRLLESFEPEQLSADRQLLKVSDQLTRWRTRRCSPRGQGYAPPADPG